MNKVTGTFSDKSAVFYHHNGFALNIVLQFRCVKPHCVADKIDKARLYIVRFAQPNPSTNKKKHVGQTLQGFLTAFWNVFYFNRTFCQLPVVLRLPWSRPEFLECARGRLAARVRVTWSCATSRARGRRRLICGARWEPVKPIQRLEVELLTLKGCTWRGKKPKTTQNTYPAPQVGDGADERLAPSSTFFGGVGVGGDDDNDDGYWLQKKIYFSELLKIRQFSLFVMKKNHLVGVFNEFLCQNRQEPACIYLFIYLFFVKLANFSSSSD